MKGNSQKDNSHIKESDSLDIFGTEENKKATEKAMSLLLVQDRTEKGLYDRLVQAGFSEEASGFAVNYVKGYGYVDDFHFATHYLACRKGEKSRRELKYKLLAKGVSEEAIAAAFEDYSREDEYDALQKQLNKKLKGRRLSDVEYKEKQKIIAFLAGKGYEFSQIRHVMGEE